MSRVAVSYLPTWSLPVRKHIQISLAHVTYGFVLIVAYQRRRSRAEGMDLHNEANFAPFCRHPLITIKIPTFAVRWWHFFRQSCRAQLFTDVNILLTSWMWQLPRREGEKCFIFFRPKQIACHALCQSLRAFCVAHLASASFCFSSALQLKRWKLLGVNYIIARSEEKVFPLHSCDEDKQFALGQQERALFSA